MPPSQQRPGALHSAAAILLFTLLTIAGAKLRLTIFAIPFTLQTVAVYGSGLFLGGPGGFLSQALYLAVGLFFPVFAGEGFGWDYLTNRPTSGYLWGFLLSSGVIGILSRRFPGLMGSFLAVAAGSAGLFTCGVIWLHLAVGHETWSESIRMGWLNLWTVDLAKITFTVSIYSLWKKYGEGRNHQTFLP